MSNVRSIKRAAKREAAKKGEAPATLPPMGPDAVKAELGEKCPVSVDLLFALTEFVENSNEPHRVVKQAINAINQEVDAAIVAARKAKANG